MIGTAIFSIAMAVYIVEAGKSFVWLHHERKRSRKTAKIFCENLEASATWGEFFKRQEAAREAAPELYTKHPEPLFIRLFYKKDD